jgi:hypothetical protein
MIVEIPASSFHLLQSYAVGLARYVMKLCIGARAP